MVTFKAGADKIKSLLHYDFISFWFFFLLEKNSLKIPEALRLTVLYNKESIIINLKEVKSKQYSGDLKACTFQLDTGFKLKRSFL